MRILNTLPVSPTDKGANTTDKIEPHRSPSKGTLPEVFYDDVLHTIKVQSISAAVLTYNIYDTTGYTVLSGSILSNTDTYSIDVSSLYTGNYTITFTINDTEYEGFVVL